MQIKDCMKHKVVSLPVSSSVEEAAKVFVENRVGTLPIIDENRKLVGLLQLRDLLTLIMPDFVRLVEDFDFVHDFGVLENRLPSTSTFSQAITEVMQEPLSVDEESGLLRAFSFLNQHRLFDLPVVNEANILVGIASRVDIGAAMLADWHSARNVE